MRKSYAKYEEILEIPNMLKIQKDSYQWFLDAGLREVFKDVGTITDFSGKLELSFLDYTMEDKVHGYAASIARFPLAGYP